MSEGAFALVGSLPSPFGEGLLALLFFKTTIVSEGVQAFRQRGPKCAYSSS